MKLVKSLLVALVVAAMLISFCPPSHAGVVAEALCAPLRKFERSCMGVKAATATLGKTKAAWLAKKCGATDAEMKQAEDCLRFDNGDKK